MKSIDIKSLLIGALLTSTVIFGVAATGKNGSPNTPNPSSSDNNQEWIVKAVYTGLKVKFKGEEIEKGWEPIGLTGEEGFVILRKRIK